MNHRSSLYRKAKRGEATTEELDYLDQLEGIPTPQSHSDGQSEVQNLAPASPELGFLNREFQAVPEPCVDCESHQKPPRSPRKKVKDESRNP